MNTLNRKLYTGIAAVALAAMPSVAYAHNAPEVDTLGRIASQKCEDGRGLFMEARVLYNEDERIPLGVVAENFAQLLKETVMYNSTNGQRVVTIEDMVTPTTFSGDYTEKDEFTCKKGKSYCTTSWGYKLSVGFVKNEAKKPVKVFVCKNGEKTCVSGAGYRVSLTYVHNQAQQAFPLLGKALLNPKEAQEQ